MRRMRSKSLPTPTPIALPYLHVRSPSLIMTAHILARYFRGCMMLDGLIVDPDYRDRGFGNRLCTHGLQIAMWDKVSVGVVATDEGSKMYSSLGFESRERFQLVDAAPWKEATLEFHAMRWDLAVEEA